MPTEPPMEESPPRFEPPRRRRFSLAGKITAGFFAILVIVAGRRRSSRA